MSRDATFPRVSCFSQVTAVSTSVSFKDSNTGWLMVGDQHVGRFTCQRIQDRRDLGWGVHGDLTVDMCHDLRWLDALYWGTPSDGWGYSANHDSKLYVASSCWISPQF